MTHFDIFSAKKAFAEGRNITEILRTQKNILFNTPDIIETAYDMQAGTYIEHVKKNPGQTVLYTTELASILNNYISPGDSLLDIGTGELTTLSYLINLLINKPQSIYAFDISWSRLFKGLVFAKEMMLTDYKSLQAFVADISEIPLLDKSINITTSSHALEPNGGRLNELMLELFRVTIDTIIIFEPCYEINTIKGKKRMEELGYIKNIDGIVKNLGGKLIDKIIIKNISNPLNPTVGFVIKPPLIIENKLAKINQSKNIFSVPGANFPLILTDDFYHSFDTGLCYPILKNIPILKSNAAILATSL